MDEDEIKMGYKIYNVNDEFEIALVDVYYFKIAYRNMKIKHYIEKLKKNDIKKIL